MNFKFDLGVTLKCIVTGFTGIATSRVEYLNGCIQYSVKPPIDKDGKMQDAIYIDQQQLSQVDEGVSVQKEKNPGGDMQDTPPAH